MIFVYFSQLGDPQNFRVCQGRTFPVQKGQVQTEFRDCLSVWSNQ